MMNALYDKIMDYRFGVPKDNMDRVLLQLKHEAVLAEMESGFQCMRCLDMDDYDDVDDDTGEMPRFAPSVYKEYPNEPFSDLYSAYPPFMRYRHRKQGIVVAEMTSIKVLDLLDDWRKNPRAVVKGFKA